MEETRGGRERDEEKERETETRKKTERSRDGRITERKTKTEGVSQ